MLLNCNVMMMKTHILSTNALLRSVAGAVVCLAFSISSQAQVEVLNGGFELNSGLPYESGMWELMNDWSNAGSESANPDYYHMFGTAGGDLPETPMAFTEVYNGRAMAGLEVSRRAGTNKREYLTGRFSEPLEVGKRYEFSFAIANGEVYENSAAGLGVSDLGIAFSAEDLDQYGREPIYAHPHFQLSTIQYYQGWKVIKFAFTANDNYINFTFGMFGSDDNKVIQSFEGPGRSKAYYFVDDFAIRTLTADLQSDDIPVKGDKNPEFDITDGTFVPTAFTPNNDGLNDEFMPYLEKGTADATLLIFDRAGTLVWESYGDTVKWEGFNLAGQPSEHGVYMWTLNVQLEDGQLKKLQGPVTLLK